MQSPWNRLRHNNYCEFHERFANGFNGLYIQWVDCMAGSWATEPTGNGSDVNTVETCLRMGNQSRPYHMTVANARVCLINTKIKFC